MVMLDKYIKQFEQDLELPPLSGLKPGVYRIDLNEGIRIVISTIPDGFLIFSELRELPKDKKENIYYQSLTSNLFGQGTKGSLLGLNDQGNMLTISRTVDYNVEYKDFKEIIDDFINAIDYWNEQLTTL